MSTEGMHKRAEFSILPSSTTFLWAAGIWGLLSPSVSYAQLPPEVRTISAVKGAPLVSSPSFVHREMPADPRERSFFLNEQAVALIMQGKKEEGETKLEESLLLNAQNTTALYNLAGVQLSEGETAKAVDTMQKAVALDSRDLSFLNRLAEAQFANNDVDAAIGTYQKLVAVDATYEQAMFRLGTLLASQKRWEQAEDALKHASLFMEDDPRALSNLGSVYIVQKKYADAKRVLEKVIQQDPSAETTLALAIANEGLSNSREALALFRKARELGSTDPSLEQHIQDLEKSIDSVKQP